MSSSISVGGEMSSSPEIVPPDFQQSGMDTEEDSQEDSRMRDAKDFVSSYCQAFDSKQHADLVDLVTQDVTFDWFGEEVHGPQPLQKFMAANIPDTRHLGVTVEPCTETSPTLLGSKRKRESSPQRVPSSTNSVLVHGKLQFSRPPATQRKAKKEWRWERNFRLQVNYSADLSPEHHSPASKWRIQQVVYQRDGQCKRALFV